MRIRPLILALGGALAVLAFFFRIAGDSCIRGVVDRVSR
jgi:hypothetical protein